MSACWRACSLPFHYWEPFWFIFSPSSSSDLPPPSQIHVCVLSRLLSSVPQVFLDVGPTLESMSAYWRTCQGLLPQKLSNANSSSGGWPLGVCSAPSPAWACTPLVHANWISVCPYVHLFYCVWKALLTENPHHLRLYSLLAPSLPVIP